MGRLLQTQHRLYSLKIIQIQGFLHSCGRQGCKTAKRPDSLVTAATQRLWETSASHRIDKPGFFVLLDGNNISIFPFFHCFYANQFKQLWPDLFCCLWTVSCLCCLPTIPPSCSLAGHYLQFIWRIYIFILNNLHYLKKPQSWVLNVYSSTMRTN